MTFELETKRMEYSEGWRIGFIINIIIKISISVNISQQGYIFDTKLTMAVVWATSISLDIAIWVDLYPPNLCHTTESSGVYNCIGEKLIALRKSCYTKERSLRMGWLTIDSFPFCSRWSWHICNWELKVVGGEGGGCGAGRENSNWWGGGLR